MGSFLVVHLLDVCPELGGCVPTQRLVRDLADAKRLMKEDGWLRPDYRYGSLWEQLAASQ